MATAEQRRFGVAGLALVFVALVAAVMASNAVLRGLRFDLTENGLFTLSDGTRSLLGKIDEPVNLYFFYSDRATQDIAALRAYANRVRELLEEFESAAKGQLTLTVIDPLPFSEDEDRAAQFGLQAVSVAGGGDPVYLGLAGTNSVGDEQIIAFFQPDKENFLEYDIAKLVSTLAQPQRTVVGLISAAPMGPGFDPMTQQMNPGWVIDDQVRQLFDLRDLSTDVDRIDDEVSVLWIVQPRDLPEHTLYAIDQFVLRGGNALIFVDPLAEADPAPANPQMPQMPTGGQSSSLGRLFDAWGLAFSTQEVVLDARNGLQVGSPSGRPVRHIGILGLTPEAMNPDDVVTASLDSINVGTAGYIAVADGSATTLEPLLSSSESAMTTAPSRFQFLADPATLLDSFAPTGDRYVIAARIGGILPSAFPRQADDTTHSDAADSGDASPEAQSETAGEHLVQSSEPANVIVVADVDMLSDRFWVQVQSFFGQRIPTAIADNGNFVINALDSLSGSDDLIGVRSRPTFARPFTKVEALRAEADARFRQTEQRLQAELNETERTLTELQATRDDTGSLMLSPEQEAEIDRFIDQRARIRTELRGVQRDLDSSIERLGTTLKAINIGLVPALLAVFGLVATWRNRNRSRRRAAS